MKITIPIHLPSLSNVRLHWAKLHRLKSAQKTATRVCLHGHELPPLPVKVTLTRVGRKLDKDNLAASFKAVQDAIADAYGVDDGNERYEWVYRQRAGKPCVEVEVEAR